MRVAMEIIAYSTWVAIEIVAYATQHLEKIYINLVLRVNAY